MYIPSKFLYTLINSEIVGVWVESNSRGDKAFIAKVPSSVAKAIKLGAKVELVIAVSEQKSDNRFLTLALKVYDRRDNPYFGILPQTVNSTNNIINSSFFDKPLSFSIYDELDSPVFSGKIQINSDSSNEDFIYDLDKMKFVTPSGTVESFELINIFGYYLGLPQYRDMNPSLYMELFTYRLTVSDIQEMLTYHVHPNSLSHYTLGKDIDGTVQETQLNQSLNLFFEQHVFQSPLVTIGKSTRELTDAFALTDDYSLIIESKCLTVNLNALNQTTDRIISNTIGHAKKALKQLVGGFKAIKRNEVIKSQSGQEIKFDRNNVQHGIVMIPEFISSNRWETIINKMITIYETYGLKVHVISLPEFAGILKKSEFDKSKLLSVLEARHHLLLTQKTIDIESINSGLPTVQDLINSGYFSQEFS